MEGLYDKNATMQVLGCILRSPLLLSETEKYNLIPEDFETKFTKYVFTAIYNMYHGGASEISIIDVDMYLSNSPTLHEDFTKNRGIEYLQDAIDIAQLGSFKYYYGRVKKFSLLRSLLKNGFDIREIYDTSLLGTKQSSQQEEEFDDLTINDIFQFLQRKFVKVEQDYSDTGQKGSMAAANGIKELKELLKISPDAGHPLQNSIFNTVVRGARKGKFYLNSGATGSGKTRTAVGNACTLAYPFRFNIRTGEWEENGNNQRVLIITTELEEEEIQTMILAYLTGINEEIILNGRYTMEEENLVDMAIKIMEHFKDNLYIERLANPTRSGVISCIRKHYILYQIGYVFYDYIFSSPGLLNEYRDLKVREDVVLMMMSTALKDIAVELNIFVWSSTQLSGEYDKKGFKDQSLLRGAKAIADKIDVGAITSLIPQEEMNLLEQIISVLGTQRPTHVTDVYKARGSKYNKVRIWGHIDLGTCRIVDYFITDAFMNQISDFKIVQYIMTDYTNITSLEDILGDTEVKTVYIPPVEQQTIISTNEEQEPMANKTSWGDLLSI